ncbi:myelin-oligodendrocyte glycoprotein-like [Salminus brasiliensis]|uniref:myelin-oligodendrocyte glycoprotein-like n=1 Tax=Salminus brasiliensis TaxID=930266 RepID=UPI003B830019
MGPCLFLVCLVLITHEASLQEIKAVVGDSVILPCSNSDEALKTTATVYWRYKDSKTVYDIIRGEAQFDEQEPAFKGRVESFPDEWRNGNFFIRLRDVRKSDSGPYTCFIPLISHQTRVYLTVTENDKQRDAENGGSGVPPSSLLLVFAFLLGCSLLYA